jgi:hypothetical protein
VTATTISVRVGPASVSGRTAIPAGKTSRLPIWLSFRTRRFRASLVRRDHTTGSEIVRQIVGVIPDPPELADETQHVHEALGVHQVETDSVAPTAAWPAARRAVSTRNGEQLT